MTTKPRKHDICSRRNLFCDCLTCRAYWAHEDQIEAKKLASTASSPDPLDYELEKERDRNFGLDGW